MSLKPRDWCFTFFIPNPDNIIVLSEDHAEICKSFLDQLHDTASTLAIKYLIYQLEVAPTTQRLHIQGYVEFKSPQRLAGAVALFPTNTRFFARSGTKQEAIDYCRKLESRAPGVTGPYEFGVAPRGQGFRSDLDSACKALEASHGDVRAVAISHPTVFVKFFKGLRELAEVYAPPWNGDKRYIIILWGDPGTGKTRTARDYDAECYMYPPPQNNGSYALNYRGEKTVCIDDFYSWLPVHFMMRLCDRYKLYVNTQGQNVEWKAERIYITSNDDPRTWWPNADAIRKKAFFRRVDEVIHKVVPASGIQSQGLHTFNHLPGYEWQN